MYADVANSMTALPCDCNFSICRHWAQEAIGGRRVLPKSHPKMWHKTLSAFHGGQKSPLSPPAARQMCSGSPPDLSGGGVSSLDQS